MHEKEYSTSGEEIGERSGKISWRSQDERWEDDKGFDREQRMPYEKKQIAWVEHQEQGAQTWNLSAV